MPIRLTSDPSPRRWLRWVILALCLILVGLLHIELVISNARSGLGAYDDASFAVVSKNLADGRGYLLSLDYGNLDHRGSLFSPKLGTGPSVILPGAAAIAVLGSEPSAPGSGLLLANALVLLLWAAVLRKASSTTRVAAYLAMFLVSAISWTILHHEHWYAFLGEYQSFILAASAFAIACLLAPRAITYFSAGLLLGLAVLSKELSALSVAAFGIAQASYIAVGVALKRATMEQMLQRLRLLFAAAIGTLVPIAAFEAYRLYSLGGVAQWHENWARHLAFVQEQGFVGDASILQRVAELNQVWGERFLHSAMVTSITTMISGFMVWRYCDDGRVRMFCWMLLCGFAAHAGYWLLMSNGWPRYAFNAVLFAASIPPALLLGAKGRKGMVLCCVATVFTIAFAWEGLRGYISGPLRDALHEPQGPTLAQSQIAAADYVEQASKSGAVIYAPWWAHMAAIEYLQREPGRFASVTDVSNQAGLLVVDTRLPLPTDDNYARLATRCVPVKEFPPTYRILRCGSAGTVSTTTQVE